MVQWLRPLAVFPEDQGSMLRTDMLAHSYLTLIPGDLMLSFLLALWVLHTHDMWHTCRKTPMHIK